MLVTECACEWLHCLRVFEQEIALKHSPASNFEFEGKGERAATMGTDHDAASHGRHTHTVAARESPPKTLENDRFPCSDRDVVTCRSSARVSFRLE
jgi:hypothetical protein